MTVNLLTIHTYQLARYIFVHELASDCNFDIEDFVNKEFFTEVFLALIKYDQRTATLETTIQYRDIIREYISMYQRTSNFYGVELKYPNQIALYQGNAICTAYINNVENQFGSTFRHVINVLLDVKSRRNQLRQTMKTAGYEAETINDTIRRQITDPPANFKLRLASRPVNTVGLTPDLLAVLTC